MHGSAIAHPQWPLGVGIARSYHARRDVKVHWHASLHKQWRKDPSRKRLTNQPASWDTDDLTDLIWLGSKVTCRRHLQANKKLYLGLQSNFCNTCYTSLPKTVKTPYFMIHNEDIIFKSPGSWPGDCHSILLFSAARFSQGCGSE